MPKKKRLLDELVELIQQGASPQELYKSGKCSKAYAYKAYKIAKGLEAQKTEEVKEIKPEVEYEYEPKEVAPEIEPIEIKPEVPEVSEEAKAEIAERVAKGFLTSEDISAIFNAVNDCLGKYKRPKESIELLGKVWEKPLNRMCEKYLDENVDLYVAVITTVIVFAPSLQMYIQDRRKAKVESKRSVKSREEG